MKNPLRIPRIPHAFFKWYCKKDRYEELHGDLEEFYYERLEDMGPVKARLYYLRDVLRCCQPYAWKTPHAYSNSNVIMFKNYFKTSLRSMVRNPLSSFINVFGLSVAIGVSIVVFTMIQFSYSIDKFHEHKDEVFLSTFFADKDGKVEQYGMTPAPLAPMLESDFAQIQKVCRVNDYNVVIKYEDHVFQERVRMADPEFLEMLTFPLRSGTASSLKDPNSIILSHAMAIKYFGYEDPVGRDILVKFSEDNKKLFKVSGIAAPFPDNRAIDFDFLMNFENLKVAIPHFQLTDWGAFVQATLIQLDDPKDIEFIKSGMNKYQELHAAVEDNWEITHFGFEALATLHERSSGINNDISTDLADEILVGLPIMGALILALACFNYINMAIGSATKRLKEIGVRKVIGANRRKVIFQFLAENVFVTFFAMFLGLFLCYTLFLPWFSEMSNSPLTLDLLNGDLWLFLSITMLVTGLVSGTYPALYISRFQVANIFRGTVRFGKKNPLMKTFLGIQMILAFIFITMAVMFDQNSNYQAKRPWGYNQHGALYVDVPDYTAYEQLSAVMAQNPNVLQVSGSRDHLGKNIYSTVVHKEDRSYDVQQMRIDTAYFSTMGISLVSGQLFQESLSANQVLVNELFVKTAGLEQPVGEFIRIDDTQFQVMGVVKDFHAFNFYYQVRPMIFRMVDKADYQHLTMRVREGAELEVFNQLKTEWTALFPEIPFEGGEQIDLWADFYAALKQMKRFTRTVAGLAVILAALGLYGLVTLNVSGRIKEFSIRKVLGAGFGNISKAITRQYLLLTIIALIVGAPLAYMMNLGLMQMMFAYPIPHGQWSVGFAFVILLLVMFGVMFTQIRRILRFNPANGLRSE